MEIALKTYVADNPKSAIGTLEKKGYKVVSTCGAGPTTNKTERWLWTLYKEP